MCQNLQKKKLCLIYNTAPRYREAIFKAIDQEFDCDWYFGPTKTDIKEMDTSLLKNVKYYKTFGDSEKYYFKWGIIRLLFKKKYQTFFCIPSTRSLSDWVFFWIAFIFFPNKKIYLWTHGWYGKESKFEAIMKLWLYRNAAGIFCYGDYACKLLEKEGINKNKLFSIHNSLDYDQQKVLRDCIQPSTVYSDHFGNNNLTIIFIGRLTKVKQLDLLVDAIAVLKMKGEIYNLTFIGDGSEGENLKMKVKNLGLENQVWFYGACYDEKINAELIYNADLCVAPGNIGLTAMHTLVFGTPVISHNDFKWQMPEFEAIRPGKTGRFFQKGSLSSLVESISCWFAEKQDQREEVRKACFNEIDNNWNPHYQMNIIKKYLKF